MAHVLAEAITAHAVKLQNPAAAISWISHFLKYGGVYVGCCLGLTIA
jgi:hypothetical protein